MKPRPPSSREQEKRAPESRTDELRPDRLEGFRAAQRLAYTCMTQIAAFLAEGVTESRVAALIEEYLGDHGVRRHFHRTYVWFGERTVFKNVRANLELVPSGAHLEAGMPVIFDIAPIVEGHPADVGYAFKLGENTLHDQMVGDLSLYRRVILASVRARKNLCDIYLDVDRLIEKQGYGNHHRRRPWKALGHRVHFTPDPGNRKAFSCARTLPSVRALFRGRSFRAEDPVSLRWDDSNRSARPPEPGIWAVEPHLGFREVGVKLEELLVITPNDAYWLDDSLPRPAPGASTAGRP